MKSSKLIMGCLATLGLTTGIAFAQDAQDEAIAERLEPVGELCLEGEDCGTAMAASSDEGGDSGSVDGETIYGNVCAACHESGAAGAPIRGAEDGWSDRVEKGFATLLDHSINGFNAMPARGGNPDLSDEEVEAATAYLVEPVMDVPEAGGEEAAAEGEATADAEASEETSGEATETASTDAEAEGGEEASGEATETAAAETETEGNGDSGLDGEALYSSSGCVACHASGAAGAPILGDAEAWAPRLEKGTEELYASAINGIGAMPPKGGSSASDEEIQAMVDYMISEVE
ncbi:c-type cytochrome [Halomonas korlensis]|uniref:c-type cytochrome n=1 Tax=Halomonas korlensis TaxID=463301 RepID=UPI001FE54303|nr:c-type cytochrome [Halomonas korlensis]